MHEERKLTDHGVLQGYKEINRGLAEIPMSCRGGRVRQSRQEIQECRDKIGRGRACQPHPKRGGCDWCVRGEFD